MAKTLRFSLSVVLAIAASSVALAQIPRTISFQGLLIDPATSKPVANGPHTIKLTIYDAANAGTALFSESQSKNTNFGVFDVVIGSTLPGGIPATVAFDNKYWLGLSV